MSDNPLDDDPPRDADLAAVRAHADQVNADGVRVLVDKLMTYRELVRQAFDFVDAQVSRSNDTTSVYRLKDHLASVNARLSELQWQLDLDHLELADLTDGCQFDGGADG